MPKIYIAELINKRDIQSWTSDVGHRLTSTVDSLRNNTDDVLERLSNGLPQPRAVAKRKNERMTYGVWTLENSRKKRRM